jgi:hypothetical protein
MEDAIKKMPVLIGLAVFLFAGMNSCVGLDGSIFNHRTVRGSGKLLSEKRPVGEINAVELGTIGTLYIEIGDTTLLEIEAEENLLEYIETDVTGGELTIDTRNVSLRTRRAINYYMTVRELEAITISSSGDIEAPDLKADKFVIKVSSSGCLDLGDLEAGHVRITINSSGDVTMGELHATSIAVDISSSGNIRIAGGEVETQDISISSSGDYRARDLASREAEVSISSSGNAIIQVSDYLGADISSSGDVQYAGDPKVDARENSSGDVRRIGGSRRSRGI